MAMEKKNFYNSKISEQIPDNTSISLGQRNNLLTTILPTKISKLIIHRIHNLSCLKK